MPSRKTPSLPVKALREPPEWEIRRAAIAICRERCAHMGEPSCVEMGRELKVEWPPETCADPGCIVLATVALVCFLNPDYLP
jgi:hypothetical protein